MRIVVPHTKEGLKILKTIQKKIEVEKKWSNESLVSQYKCRESAYKCDYPYIDMGMICPVCKAMVEEE